MGDPTLQSALDAWRKAVRELEAEETGSNERASAERLVERRRRAYEAAYRRVAGLDEWPEGDPDTRVDERDESEAQAPASR